MDVFLLMSTRLSINGLPRGGQQSVARGSWPHYLRTGTLKTGNRMVRLIVEQVYMGHLVVLYGRNNDSDSACGLVLIIVSARTRLLGAPYITRIGCLRPHVAISCVFYCLNLYRYRDSKTVRGTAEYCDRGRGRTRASRMRRAPVRPRPQALAVSRPVSACAVSAGLDGCHVGRKHLGARMRTSRRSSDERHPNPQPSRTHSMLQKREKSEP